jgi:hypothetical protein
LMTASQSGYGRAHHAFFVERIFVLLPITNPSRPGIPAERVRKRRSKKRDSPGLARCSRITLLHRDC